MSFSPHINTITSYAIKSLNFVRCKRDESIKSVAYLGLICSKLEYASAVWDPHLLKDITKSTKNSSKIVKSNNYNWEKVCQACFLNLINGP